MIRHQFQRYWGILFLLFGYSGLYAEGIQPNLENTNSETQKLCAAVQHIPVEANTSDVSDNCDALALYYGFEAPPNYINARQCALAQKDYGVLTMIYANGLGTKANLDVAMYYACQMDAAPAELNGRIEHLNQMKTQADAKKPFDICDDMTSGYMMGWCAAIDQRFAQAKLHKELDSIVTHWSTTDKQALEPLLGASSNFIKIRAHNEIDQSGTGRAAFVIEEEMELNQQFLALLKQASQCTLPQISLKDQIDADKKLNQIYINLQNHPLTSFATITHEGIKKTERAWIGYRDSWVNFVKVKCPDIPSREVETLMTQHRIKQLLQLESYIDQ